MVKFTPCSACQRHVRLSDESCPFCGASHASAVPRSFAAPEGAKRAILFALSTTLSAACGDDSMGSTQPVYGAPVMLTTAATQGEPTVSSSAPRATATATAANTLGNASATPSMSTGPAIQPPYGAIPFPISTTDQSAATPDANAPTDDAGVADAEVAWDAASDTGSGLMVDAAELPAADAADLLADGGDAAITDAD